MIPCLDTRGGLGSNEMPSRARIYREIQGLCVKRLCEGCVTFVRGKDRGTFSHKYRKESYHEPTSHRSHYSCGRGWSRCCPGRHLCAPIPGDYPLLYWFRCLENVQLLVCPDVGVAGLGLRLVGADALAG